jgi:hypothetical protein
MSKLHDVKQPLPTNHSGDRSPFGSYTLPTSSQMSAADDPVGSTWFPCM